MRQGRYGMLLPVGTATFLGLLAAGAILQVAPPRPKPATEPLPGFSAERAMRHLEAIAHTPRPIGSEANARARSYILAELRSLGVAPEEQTSVVLREGDGSFLGGMIHNVAARIRGTGGTKAILVMAHYDTVSTSPGASDDGHAVAAMLEIVRALKSAPPLNNDVIMLFTDGEEVGLLGAEAFADGHPWARDVAVVVNLEAAGTGGAVWLFETSDRNGWLVRQFAESVPYPIGGSIGYEVYKRLPRNTDLSPFKRRGYAGMNFAYIDHPMAYHTRLDNIANLDQGSMQQQGSNTLALVRRFGELSLDDIQEPNRIYFNPVRFWLVTYPEAWAVPLAGVTLVFFLAVLVVGFRRGSLTLPTTAAGLGAFLLCLVAGPLIVAGALRLILKLHPWYAQTSDVYNAAYYRWGFTALVLAMFGGFYGWLFRKIGPIAPYAGSVLVITVVQAAVAVYLPSGSYLLTWPALAGTASLWVLFGGERKRLPLTLLKIVLLATSAAVAVLLLAPLVHQLFVAMGLGAAPSFMALVVLTCGVLVPHWHLMLDRNRWWVTAVCGAACLALLATGSLTAGFDQDHPGRNSLFYAYDADKNAAVWASGDRRTDEWTRELLSDRPELRSLPEISPFPRSRYLASAAPPAPVPAPAVEILADRTHGDRRVTTLRINSRRSAEMLLVFPPASVPIYSLSVNGHRQIAGAVAAGNPAPRFRGLLFYGLPADGLTLGLELGATPELTLRVLDSVRGLENLPGISIRPRPPHLMPAQRFDPFTDSVVSGATIRLAPAM